MDEPAPKRRRVSSEADAPAAATTTRAAAPAAGPDAPTTNNPPPLQSPTRRIRPSFASPTRASLARYNPQILERRRSASASPFKPADSAALRPPLGPVRSAQQLFGPQAAPSPPSADNNNPPASRPDQARDAQRQTEATSESAVSARSELGSPPRRTPVKPSPRPLPPPAPEGDDELNTLLARMQRPSRNTGVPIRPPPEPELPPAVSDPISSTPPRGIHSSPRWRDREKQKKMTSPMKSSPLKPRVDSPARARERIRGTSQSPYRRALGTSRPLQDLGLNANTNAARLVPAPNKNINRIRERDRLRREIAALQKEVHLAARENERIRMQRAGRAVAPVNEADVLNLVQKTLVKTGTAPSPGLAHQMAQAALNPMGILPFGPSKLVPQQEDSDTDEKDIKSHHPVQMSAEDELPFLQLFSAFSATSQVSVLPSVPNQPIRQRRQVILRSRDIPGLFTARVDMVVNAMNLNILALRVPALEPCARPELGPFVDKICSGDCNRSMQNNVGIISWAMGEWYRLAVRRARFWSQLERNLAAKGDYMDSVAQMRTQADVRDGSDFDSQDEALDRCDKADLFRFLGQQSYDVPIPSHSEASQEPAVRLEWKIDLDWTGEAQNKLGLFLGVPGKWREADERGVFAKFPKLFEDLIQGGQNPRKAVRTIVALLTSA
ncbi:hypothetical protein QQS21_004456 [Conoideocrella luteorostrata]|uniref:Uncharacterized protein n=1 Tax=Conoideocrella luteorostrata TaxID=1105319 RepID=A0AAJ0CSD3_9HYPO|nr:hypothetical protein QQS21_004456 [Conoideocrella luteorostrata]